jgi:hypothetical protein
VPQRRLLDRARSSTRGVDRSAGRAYQQFIAFGYGDFRRVHRTGLIACVYRASAVAAQGCRIAGADRLQCLDKATG